MELRKVEAGAVALVTGASSGIGAATAELLVARGARVALTARRLERVAPLAARLGTAATALELDVDDDASVGSLLQRLPEGWREIDILVNNAGHDLGGRKPFDEGSLADWRGIIETNVQGMIRVTHAVVPGMLARGGGQIVNLGSTSGVGAIVNDAVYIMSKHAVHGFSRAIRLDYEGRLRVIEIMPGLVRTGFAAARWRGDRAKADAFYDGAPHMLPEDVAETIVFAVSLPPRAVVAELLLVPGR